MEGTSDQLVSSSHSTVRSFKWKTFNDLVLKQQVFDVNVQRESRHSFCYLYRWSLITSLFLLNLHFLDFCRSKVETNEQIITFILIFFSVDDQNHKLHFDSITSSKLAAQLMMNLYTYSHLHTHTRDKLQRVHKLFV